MYNHQYSNSQSGASTKHACLRNEPLHMHIILNNYTLSLKVSHFYPPRLVSVYHFYLQPSICKNNIGDTSAKTKTNKNDRYSHCLHHPLRFFSTIMLVASCKNYVNYVNWENPGEKYFRKPCGPTMIDIELANSKCG